jgi:hypothetical protein
MSDYKVISTVAAANIKIISNIAVADIRSVTGDAKQPAGGFEGEYDLDGIDKFTSTRAVDYGTDSYSWQGPWTGIRKDGLGTGWNAAARSIAEITDDTFAYVQWKLDIANPDSGQWNLMVGLGYVGDDNADSTTPYDWCTWQWWLHAGGTQIYNGRTDSVPYTDWALNWRSGGGPNAASNRLCRIEVNSGTVTFVYSDDGGASWTTVWTDAVAVDIAGNSNLVASVSFNSAHGFQATPENLKIYGNLVNT